MDNAATGLGAHGPEAFHVGYCPHTATVYTRVTTTEGLIYPYFECYSTVWGQYPTSWLRVEGSAQSLHLPPSRRVCGLWFSVSDLGPLSHISTV